MDLDAYRARAQAFATDLNRAHHRRFAGHDGAWDPDSLYGQRGRTTVYWVRAGADAYGVDLTEEAVEHTRRRLEVYGLRAEVRDLEESNEILKQASIFFARELDPRHR